MINIVLNESIDVTHIRDKVAHKLEMTVPANLLTLSSLYTHQHMQVYNNIDTVDK